MHIQSNDQSTNIVFTFSLGNFDACFGLVRICCSASYNAAYIHFTDNGFSKSTKGILTFRDWNKRLQRRCHSYAWALKVDKIFGRTSEERYMDQHGSLIRNPVLMVYLFCSPTKTVSCFSNVHYKDLTRIAQQKNPFSKLSDRYSSIFI